jgi:cation:H+ antiporter
MTVVLILAGFVALVAGGELLVRGAVGAARRARVSPMLIGLTLVGFGTSTPELVTSLQAAFAGAPGIAVGNVVGSNICNVLLILGVAAAVAPIAVRQAEIRRDGAAVVLATAFAMALMLRGSLGPVAGAALVAGLAAYLVLALKTTPRMPDTGDVPPPLGRSLGQFAVGLALTVFGARMLVSGAIDAAASLGVSEAVIGLTIVAVGTSLPELVTSVVAARRGASDVALGNILGSNIFNMLGILGATALARTIPVPEAILDFDVWVMAAATVALVLVAVTGWRITRGEGVALLAAYGGYLAWLVATA